MKDKWDYSTPGIPDDMFIRGKVPMTKEEVRALTISKLRLKSDSILLDVGAGTGSVSIEAALICDKGKVISIERNLEGIELIKKNAEKFNVSNINILEGKAPDDLKNITNFNRVFIGGSGGRLRDILEYCSLNMTNGGVIVVNAIAIETLYKAINLYKAMNFSNIDVTSITVAKGKSIGRYTMMEGLNPIYIISAQK